MASEWLSAQDTVLRIVQGELTAAGALDAYLARIEKLDGQVGAYLAVDADGAHAQAAEIDRRRTAGEPLGPLAGVPIALKDVLVTKDLATTAASKILEGWKPPYDGTAVQRLRAAGAVIVGKVNCDEFAMGSSTENSAYKQTKNPWDVSRVPGGSSGGSSAAVAAALCSASLGTDTGGSIRQPAAFCGVVGIKPTYGRVSRWGVVAFASSLDQVGPLTRTVGDSALLLETICGHDPLDSTSLDQPVPKFTDALTGDVKGLRVGIPAEYFTGAIDDEVRSAVQRAAAALQERGAELIDISLPNTELALPAYYVVAPAEASSNLARYDGIRFGRAASGAKDLLDLYQRSRGEGFGPEVKRRIMLGTYALRSGYYDAYYKKAQQIRALIKRDFDKAWQHVDVVLTPTTPTAAFRFGAKSSPVDMYLADIFTLACNLAGLPGISVPCGLTVESLPIGAQLMGKPLDEATLLRAAHVIEKAVGLGDKRPKGVS
ncbi:MAG TPA: Asp-tRNA(Asn)/Glu-tRNA(Gln) amidotransferase subunit GatA [Kofleriaceae bacterium]|nr:Asp-tRNA(Asn)/Glu-tRNA(Gln) amidotransferase subunit GatA [Kofleriaceae bacterium]